MEARRKFGEMLEDVRRGDEVVIERAGKIMGVLIPPDRYKMIEASREHLVETIERIREHNKDVPEKVIAQDVDEAVRAVRSKRTRSRRAS
jgi:prevent-host-death family protein